MMIPINPGLEGHDCWDRKVYAKLADVPEPSTWSYYPSARTRRHRARKRFALNPRPQ